MNESSSLAQAREWLDRLRKLADRKECRSCDCLQGLLTQLELDHPELSGSARPIKTANQDMHGCLGCDPCPPGALFAEYLRRQNDPAGEDGARDRREGETRGIVREQYGKIASQDGACCGPKSSCCGASDPGVMAKELGYSEEDLAALPEGANMGLSCGNPTAIASLMPGEAVLDLGSGGGFDVFIAARKVGPEGRAIGVDMTPEMVEKARRNAETFRERTGLANMDFRLGEIEHLPVADNSVDVIISNCVVNLSPDKAQVWREMFRALKPGGRVAVSDLALLQPLPDALSRSVEALVGCVAGAVAVEETRAMAEAAGLTEIECASTPEAIDAMSGWNDPLYAAVRDALPAGKRIGDYVTSLYVTARKPASRCCRG